MTKKQAQELSCFRSQAARRRGRPVQMDMSAREEAILEAAGALLTEGGFDHVTMAAIARRAGMSKRTLYEHFEGQEALLGRVISRMAETIFRPLSPDDANRPLPERLRLLLTLNKPPGSEASKLELLRTIIARAQTYPTLSREMLMNGRQRLVGYVRTELERALQAGEIFLQQDQASLAADFLVSMAFEDPLPRLLDPSLPETTPGGLARRRDLAISLFLGGCGRDGGSAENLGAPA